ncbi:MAG: F0F1 ATP synthase subunit epsilon [Anaerolineae bacterium]
MAAMKLDIVTIERSLFAGEANMVIAPGIEGEMGILPRHAPLITALNYGELTVRTAGEEDRYIAIGGGFIEVQPDHVVVLADVAEYAEEIDIERAEAARRRAEEQLAQAKREDVDFIRAEAALRRSMLRLKVARRRRRGTGGMPTAGGPPPVSD